MRAHSMACGTVELPRLRQAGKLVRFETPSLHPEWLLRQDLGAAISWDHVIQADTAHAAAPPDSASFSERRSAPFLSKCLSRYPSRGILTSTFHSITPSPPIRTARISPCFRNSQPREESASYCPFDFWGLDFPSILILDFLPGERSKTPRRPRLRASSQIGAGMTPVFPLWHEKTASACKGCADCQLWPRRS